ncbi:hypothetical protein CSR02_00025 [Acetobacter pomorum]|uniref:Uncharacterized protein n=1 Tax=Acetobacter pomorum TaxID=65959 RepID=A0A2G4RG75_9PROT|nr:hypothetical protein [Acetobacter pomorum]PHY95567.1 hypothetical protein CSR02_00025 [Acetobacter pomorum]GBR50048.1 hypothetical protein AA11825_1553 [Acetobacter pomorum DSM 11825]
MKPPPSIAWLVEALGEETTLQFIETCGGQRIMIPRGYKGSLLENLYGEDLAKIIVEKHAGQPWQVPLAKTWRVYMLARRGLSHNEIAARLGISWRQVTNLYGKRPDVDRRVGSS